LTVAPIISRQGAVRKELIEELHPYQLMEYKVPDHEGEQHVAILEY
jgi:hypothetical protein